MKRDKSVSLKGQGGGRSRGKRRVNSNKDLEPPAGLDDTGENGKHEEGQGDGQSEMFQDNLGVLHRAKTARKGEGGRVGRGEKWGKVQVIPTSPCSNMALQG